MARGSPKCPNCKATLKEDSDYCQKCGMRFYFKCNKCERRWPQQDGAICPDCGSKATS